jgi:hypothetical protein
MRLEKMWKLIGNIDRVMELSNAGYEPNAISGIFKDNGITVSPDFVHETQKGAENLSNKGLPKSVCNEKIASLGEVQISFA